MYVGVSKTPIVVRQGYQFLVKIAWRHLWMLHSCMKGQTGWIKKRTDRRSDRTSFYLICFAPWNFSKNIFLSVNKMIEILDQNPPDQFRIPDWDCRISEKVDAIEPVTLSFEVHFFDHIINMATLVEKILGTVNKLCNKKIGVKYFFCRFLLRLCLLFDT